VAVTGFESDTNAAPPVDGGSWERLAVLLNTFRYAIISEMKIDP